MEGRVIEVTEIAEDVKKIKVNNFDSTLFAEIISD